MAVIGSYHFKGIVQIGYGTTENNIYWAGAGIFYGKRTEIPNSYLIFLVTCKHIFKDVGENRIFIRVNSIENSIIREVPGGIKAWTFHPDTEHIDIAVTNSGLAAAVENEPVEYWFYTEGASVSTVDELRQSEVSEGQSIIVMGFPHKALGITERRRKYPIVRRGCIARISDLLNNEQDASDFLIDCHIYPGNSGGPVLLMVEKQLNRTKPVQDAFVAARFSHLQLIGLVKAYLPYREEVVVPGRLKLYFEENSGITLVDTVDSIMQTVDYHLKRSDAPLD